MDGEQENKTKQSNETIAVEISEAILQSVKGSAEHRKMKAEIGEVGFGESSEERRLWKERGHLERQIEKKEKMLHNTEELFRPGWGVQGRNELIEEANEMRREIQELRQEITLVDREIRAAEKDGSKELEEATTKESKARQKEECFHALVQTRMRMGADARTISELEDKLREMDGL